MIAAAVLLLAIESARTLRLEYRVAADAPEIDVSFFLPSSAASDIEQVTSTWLVPIEAAVRSLGDVASTRGSVGPDHAQILVRFTPSTDPDVKAARLVSELASLRRSLPERATLNVRPLRRRDSSSDLVLALSGPSVAERAEGIAEELRSAPGVREVTTWGSSRLHTDIRIRRDAPPGVTPESIARSLEGKSEATKLGRTTIANRIVDVVEQGRGGFIAAGPTLVPVAAVASRETTRRDPERVARLNGRRVVILRIYRDEETPLLRFHRGIRERIPGDIAVDEIWSTGAELRRFLMTGSAGLAAAIAILFLAGGVHAALVPLLAVALTIHVAALTRVPVDLTTIVGALSGIALTFPLSLLLFRQRRAAAILLVSFAALLPVAVTLGSGGLAPFLSLPARAFLAGVACGVAATGLTSARRQPATKNAGFVKLLSLMMRRAFRAAAAVIIGTFAVSWACFTWFGKTLDPRAAGSAGDRGPIYVNVTLPPGGDLRQAEDTARTIERVVGRFREIERQWSTLSREHITVVAEIRQRTGQPRREQMIRQLAMTLPIPRSAFRIGRSESRTDVLRIGEDIGERPSTDEESSFYRMILRSTDVASLFQTLETLTTRAVASGVERQQVRPESEPARPRLELLARPGTSPETAAAVAGALRTLTEPVDVVETPDGSWRSIAAAETPAKPEEIPRQKDLFRRIVGTATLDSTFVTRTAYVTGEARRELGQFVLPITVSIPGWVPDQRKGTREALDRSLALVPLPPNTSLSRPSLSSWALSREKLRLFQLAGFLPLLLFAASATVLASLRNALLALAPGATAIAAAGPLFLVSSSDVGELAWVSLASAITVITAFSTLPLLRSRSVSTAYRAARDLAAPFLFGSLAAASMLVIAAISPEASRGGWRGALVAAGGLAAVGMPLAAVLPALLHLIGSDLRRRTSREFREQRRPQQWEDPRFRPHLAARNVTKVYSNGYRALARVSFEISPGITALLGPNGAGKTTLLRILTGLLEPTRGTIELADIGIAPETLSAYRRLIGFLPQESNAYSGFTARQFLDYWMIERGIDDARSRATEIEELLEVVGLTGAADRRVRDFSGGMRQRIGIARALIGRPPILIVDEPTTGLDIEARERFRGLMRAIAVGRIVIISTHIASDVESVASRVLLLDRGTLRFDGSPDRLIARGRGRVFEAVVGDTEARALNRRMRITTRVRTPEGIRIRAVVPDGAPLEGAEVEPTLEEAYLSVVGDPGRVTTGFAFLSRRRSES